MSARERPRRTQAERRAATIRRLIDGAAAALVEVGYARTTVQEICRRAGVSHGGLFRHFASREALLVAVAEDTGARMLAGYRRRFEDGPPPEDPLLRALELLREACRSAPNQAWYELAVAARTHPSLREAMEPLATEYYERILLLARALLPDLAAAWGERFDPLVEVLVAVFDGEQHRHFLTGSTEEEERRLAVLRGLLDPSPT